MFPKVDGVYIRALGGSCKTVMDSHPHPDGLLTLLPFWSTTITSNPPLDPRDTDSLIRAVSKRKKKITTKQESKVVSARVMHVNENRQNLIFYQGYRLRCAPSYWETSGTAAYTGGRHAHLSVVVQASCSEALDSVAGPRMLSSLA